MTPRVVAKAARGGKRMADRVHSTESVQLILQFCDLNLCALGTTYERHATGALYLLEQLMFVMKHSVLSD